MKKLAIVGVVAMCLALPALAVAKSIKVSGGVVGDDTAKISAKTIVKDGKVQKVKAFKANGIDIRCDGETVDGFGFTITGSLSVNDSGTFKARLPNREDPSEKLRVSGKVKKKGKRISGNIKTNKLTINGTQCDMPKQHYELTK